MKLTIKTIGRSKLSNREGGLDLTCAHDRAEVSPPCCKSFNVSDCDCRGEYSVYCPDCISLDIPEEEITELIDGYRARGGLSFAR